VVWVICEIRIPSSSIEGRNGQWEAGRAQCQVITMRIGIGTGGWDHSSRKFSICTIYIPLARTRAGMYYRQMTHPAAILVEFCACTSPMVRRAALVAFVDLA